MSRIMDRMSAGSKPGGIIITKAPNVKDKRRLKTSESERYDRKDHAEGEGKDGERASRSGSGTT